MKVSHIFDNACQNSVSVIVPLLECSGLSSKFSLLFLGTAGCLSRRATWR